MTRAIYRLPPNAAESITQPGYHADGGNLYLFVGEDGRRRSWAFIYYRNGKRHEAGLGPAGKGGVSLKAARALAEEKRALLRSGIDPIAHRAKAAPVAPLAFGSAAADYIAAHKGNWSPKHARQWADTLAVYCDCINKLPVNTIDTPAVLKVLTPLWGRAPETAARLRGRIEAILDAARTLGHIDANVANPARWKGHLDTVLPKRDRLSYKNHTAVPYADVPAFIERLHTLRGVAALALEFCILTATRTGETLGTRFDEVDLVNRVWTLPRERVKTGVIHRVPLSNRALAIVAAQKAKAQGNPYVFPGQYPNTCLTDASLLMVMRRLKVPATVHGFRSSFRDWAGDETHTAREIAEHALGHQVGKGTERAYRRGDALERRRVLMDAWCAYICGGADDGSNVVEMRRAAE